MNRHPRQFLRRASKIPSRFECFLLPSANRLRPFWRREGGRGGERRRKRADGSAEAVGREGRRQAVRAARHYTLCASVRPRSERSYGGEDGERRTDRRTYMAKDEEQSKWRWMRFPGTLRGRLLLLMARSVVEKGRGGLAAVVDAAAVPADAEVAPESVLTAAAAPVAAGAPPPWLADMTRSVAARASFGLLELASFPRRPDLNSSISYLSPPLPSLLALQPTHEHTNETGLDSGAGLTTRFLALSLASFNCSLLEPASVTTAAAADAACLRSRRSGGQTSFYALSSLALPLSVLCSAQLCSSRNRHGRGSLDSWTALYAQSNLRPEQSNGSSKLSSFTLRHHDHSNSRIQCLEYQVERTLLMKFFLRAKYFRDHPFKMHEKQPTSKLRLCSLFYLRCY